VTAADVLTCLRVRWPDAEYLTIEEAPEDSSRSGRKIDLLVVSLWKSRGLELDGVEVKVSLGDWRRELERASKADFWWRHTHRFWIAAPLELAAKVRDELPETWGLLGCATGKKTKVVAKAPKRTAEPLSWSSCVGLMRAAAGAGINALHRARSAGYDQGVEVGEQRAARTSGVPHLRELRERVANFEARAGIKIDSYDADGIADLVRMLERERLGPGWVMGSLGREARNLRLLARQMGENAERAEKLAERITVAATNANAPGHQKE
jgi:hypothetical protein